MQLGFCLSFLFSVPAAVLVQPLCRVWLWSFVPQKLLLRIVGDGNLRNGTE